MKLILFIYLMLLASISSASSVDPEIAVNTHNYWRNLLNQGSLESQPVPNPYIADMYWDESLADSAQAHSDKCVWEHSGVSGENLYAHTGDMGSMEDGVNLWAQEHENYDYDSNTSINGNVIGHYTQVVWENTLKVGCGKTQCSPILKSDGSVLFTGTIYTCQYQQPGNWVGQKSYRTTASLTEQVAYNSNNQNLDFQLININGEVFRAKLTIKSTDPLVFAIISYEQVNNINLDDYPDIAYFEGTSIIIPKLTIDGVTSYTAELKHIGNSEYEVINVQ